MSVEATLYCLLCNRSERVTLTSDYHPIICRHCMQAQPPTRWATTLYVVGCWLLVLTVGLVLA